MKTPTILAWAVVYDTGVVAAVTWAAANRHFLNEGETPEMRCRAWAEATARRCGGNARVVELIDATLLGEVGT